MVQALLQPHGHAPNDGGGSPTRLAWLHMTSNVWRASDIPRMLRRRFADFLRLHSGLWYAIFAIRSSSRRCGACRR